MVFLAGLMGGGRYWCRPCPILVRPGPDGPRSDCAAVRVCMKRR